MAASGLRGDELHDLHMARTVLGTLGKLSAEQVERLGKGKATLQRDRDGVAIANDKLRVVLKTAGGEARLVSVEDLEGKEVAKARVDYADYREMAE